MASPDKLDCLTEVGALAFVNLEIADTKKPGLRRAFYLLLLRVQLTSGPAAPCDDSERDIPR